MLDGRLFGFYRSKVTENSISSDELKEYGAVRVFIPDLMAGNIMPDFDEEEMGLIAYPANNPFGGRNDVGEGSYGVGTVYVPRKGEWVWVFFEQGDKKKPFYMNAINIKNTKLPPENRVNYEGDALDEPHTVYTIIRTYAGRSIIVADSEDVQRVEITGKKSGPAGKPDASDQDSSYHTIDGNQTTILFDEREGKEKVLIRTKKGDFFHIDIDDQKLQAYFKSDILLKTDGGFHLQAAKDIYIQSKSAIKTKSANLHMTADMKASIMGMKEMNLSSPNIKSTGTLGIDMQTGGNIIKQAAMSVNTIAGVNIDSLAGTNVNIKAGKILATDGTMRFDQSGLSTPPIPPTAQPALPAEKPVPVDPQGERET